MFIAHVRYSDKQPQSVANHLTETAAITRELAAKLDLSEAGELGQNHIPVRGIVRRA